MNCYLINSPFPIRSSSSSASFSSLSLRTVASSRVPTGANNRRFFISSYGSSASYCPRFYRREVSAIRSMATDHSQSTPAVAVPNASMTLLFVEMGVGYDQHGQDVTAAAMRACRDAISSNSIPAFRRAYWIEGVQIHLKLWSIPGVSSEKMKLQIKLGVPQPIQQSLNIDKVKSVFPYGKIENVEVVDGGLICSSGVHVEEMGDKNDDCYIVNAAVYVGY